MSKIRTSRGFARFKNICQTPADYASAVEIMTSRPWLTAEGVAFAVAIAAAVALALWVAV